MFARNSGRRRRPLILACLALLVGAAPFAARAQGAQGWAACSGQVPDAAIDACSKIIASFGPKETVHNKAAAFYNRANAYVAKRDYERAFADFSKALELEPKSASVLSARAAAYRSQGDYASAVKDLDAAIKLEPKNPEGYIGRGAARYALHDLDGAIADFGEALKLNPTYGPAFTARAKVYMQERKEEKALADFAEAVKYDKTATPYLSRGDLYLETKDFDRAIADFTEGLKRDPKSVLALVDRGSAWRGKGELDKAIADYDAALKIDATLVPALYNRASVWRMKKDLPRAKADYEAILKVRPDFPEAKKGLEEVDRLLAWQAQRAAKAARPLRRRRSPDRKRNGPAQGRAAALFSRRPSGQSNLSQPMSAGWSQFAGTMPSSPVKKIPRSFLLVPNSYFAAMTKVRCGNGWNKKYL